MGKTSLSLDRVDVYSWLLQLGSLRLCWPTDKATEVDLLGSVLFDSFLGRNGNSGY